jgi:hypothetical protein
MKAGQTGYQKIVSMAGLMRTQKGNRDTKRMSMVKNEE